MLDKTITKHTTEQPGIFSIYRLAIDITVFFVAPNKLFKQSGFSLILHPTLQEGTSSVHWRDDLLQAEQRS